MLFDHFKLHPSMFKALTKMGFETPTPIQDKSIPPLLDGRDLLGSAQTGSGKTVAFALPLLSRLLTDKPAYNSKEVQAVILVPTRELAAQVEATIVELTHFCKLKSALVIGGTSMRQQILALQGGVDILIATPGRLLDHLHNTRGFHLKNCRFLVLDEADRMLDMGFLPDVSRILKRIPAERQTSMFSATVPVEIERLVNQFMKNPLRVQIDPPSQPATGIRQKIYPITAQQKYDLLLALLNRSEVSSALVFTATKRRADLVSSFLGLKDVSCAALHSDLSQAKRTQTIEAFRAQKNKVLVATDIAARGLDIRHVSHVINFDVPLYPEDYLHRIGRTARAFSVGDALTLMSPTEKSAIDAIEGFVKTKIERCALEGFPYDVPPQLESKKPSIHSRFRMGRRKIRSGGRGLF